MTLSRPVRWPPSSRWSARVWALRSCLTSPSMRECWRGRMSPSRRCRTRARGT